ncbi:MAG: hypothetical protein IPL79_08880 [Myxococcales bacterium]|nr:hypothetical protein [Myxococcales bacterium]
MCKSVLQTTTSRGLLLAAFAAAALGCSDGVNDAEDAPVLLGLSDSSIQVGHKLSFVGEKFLDPKDGRTIMRFDGVFEGSLADYDVAAYDVRTARTTENEVSWPFFGHYQVPFAPDGDDLGTFRGTVTPVNVKKDGAEIVGAPLEVTLTVLPSIVLYGLEPVVAEYQCAKPSMRILGGYAYEMTAATLDFPARTLSINISGEPGVASGGRTIVVPMTGSIGNSSMALLGDNRQLVLAPVPDDATMYIAEVRLTAIDDDNKSITVVYPIPVHRPLAFIPSGEPRLAQIEQAVPVSGCMAGGLNGSNVRYEETQSETRTRQVQYRWDSNWSSEKSDQTSTTTDWRNGSNTGFSGGGDHNWGGNWSENLGGSLGGSGTIGGGLAPGSVTVHAEVSYGKTWGGHDGGSENWSTTGGNDRSDGGAETLTTTIGVTQGGSEGVSEFYDVSSTRSITNASINDIIPNMYGIWFRQVTRWSHPASVIEFDLCGEPHVVAEVEIADYQWGIGLGQGTSCAEVKPSLPEPVCYLGC